jgi:hypothetical protein
LISCLFHKPVIVHVVLHEKYSIEQSADPIGMKKTKKVMPDRPGPASRVTLEGIYARARWGNKVRSPDRLPSSAP